MAKLNDERIQAAFQPYLNEGETLRYWAFGVKQPNMFLLIFLIALAVLPGIIAVFLLTKNYLIGLTDKRFLVLQIKGPGNAGVKQIMEYNLDEVRRMPIKTSTGGLFTHIRIEDATRPFVAKFHRAFSKNNRPHAMAISEALAPGGAG